MASTDRRIAALDRKRAEMKDEIEAERERPSPDSAKILELKRRRVHLKDEVQHLRMAG